MHMAADDHMHTVHEDDHHKAWRVRWTAPLASWWTPLYKIREACNMTFEACNMTYCNSADKQHACTCLLQWHGVVQLQE